MEVFERRYDIAWFEQRAYGALRKLDNGTWDYSDSLLLYSPQGQYAYETAQQTNTPYFDLVTKPGHDYLKVVVTDIVDMLPESFDYIDLGPGTEDKENYFFEALHERQKKFVYIPVDISEYFLKAAEENATGQGISTRSIQTSFEELPGLLGESAVQRFVSLLGLTFSNYLPSDILSLLQKIAGKNGYVLVDVQLKERVDILRLQEVYQEYVAPACDKKIALLGLDPHRDVSPQIADSEIAIWTTILQTNERLEKIGITPGDRIKLFQSCRPTKESFESSLGGLQYQLFDTGSSFIAAMIRT